MKLRIFLVLFVTYFNQKRFFNNSEYQPNYLWRKPYAHIINEQWYVAVFFHFIMTCKRDIFNYWCAPNFARIADEYHITTMLKWWARSHASTAVGGANRPWGRLLHFTIGANDPALIRANAKSGRVLQYWKLRGEWTTLVRHVAGNVPPGFYAKYQCDNSLKHWHQHQSGLNTPYNKMDLLLCCFNFNLIFLVLFIMTFGSITTIHRKRP